MRSPGEADRPRPRTEAPGWPGLPLLLAALALWDLRGDLLLLLDRPTITAALYLLRDHPLAVLVLLLQPSLWKRYRRH